MALKWWTSRPDESGLQRVPSDTPHQEKNCRSSCSPWGGKCRSRIVDGNLDLDAGLDRDGRDLLHDVARRVQVDDALVDAHLPAVVRVRALAARRLADHERELLRREAHRAVHRQLLVLGAAHEVRADLLEGLHVAAAEGDADAVELGLLALHRLRLGIHRWRM